MLEALVSGLPSPGPSRAVGGLKDLARYDSGVGDKAHLGGLWANGLGSGGKPRSASESRSPPGSVRTQCKHAPAHKDSMRSSGVKDPHLSGAQLLGCG